ncbi:MAG TPA: preprotein translocase subunit SecG [Candidatus Micrarchaeia archaeon]|nr:preprotein translocase subunit SecG [Candidatus Micrarchaeia archaeon]
MKTLFGALDVAIAIVIMATILLQTPKASGLGGTIGGGSDGGGGYRTRRGLERTLFHVSIALGFAFAVIALIQIRIS